MSERNEPRGGVRVLKLALSICWLAVVKVRRRGATAVVLYYHDVPAERRAAFGRQLDLLQRRMRIVDPLELSSTMSGAHVAITFDDGLVSFADNAVPELSARGLPSAVFVPSAFLSRPPSWVTDGRFDLDVERVMNEDRLRALPPDLVRVGSHTASHPDLTRLTEATTTRELRESRGDTLEAILRRPVTRRSASPSARTATRWWTLVVQAGYQRRRLTDRAAPTCSGSVASRGFVIHRVAVKSRQ